MSRSHGVFFFLTMVMLALGLSLARSEEKKQSQRQAGAFDYYLLSLSWSPEHCAEPAGVNDHQQCDEGRRYGFIVHGLWPEYEKGYPQFCSGNPQVSSRLVQKMLPIMPSEQLIRHEWQKHGTCSGLTAEQYFEKVEDAFARVTIPARYKNPPDAIAIAPSRLKQDLVTANPQFIEESFALLCQGRFLSEVRVCMDKDLKPRSCSADVRDSCRPKKIILRPVR